MPRTTKPRLGLPLSMIIVPAGVVILSFIISIIVNAILSGTIAAAIINTILFIFGFLALLAFVPLLTVGIVLLLKRRDAAAQKKKDYRGFGITAMVLGIVGLVFCWVPVLGFVTAVLGLIFGAIALKSTARGMAITGFVLGIIGAAWAVIYTIVLIIAAYAGITMAAQDASVKSDAAAINTAVTMFLANNEGQYPSRTAEIAGYLPLTIDAESVTVINYHDNVASPTAGQFMVVTDAECTDGDGSTSSSPYVVMAQLPSSGDTYCIDG